MLVFKREGGILSPVITVQSTTRQRIASSKQPRVRPLHVSSPGKFILDHIKEGTRFLHVHVPGTEAKHKQGQEPDLRDRTHTIAYRYDLATGEVCASKSVYTAPLPTELMEMSTEQRLQSSWRRSAHNTTAAVRLDRRPITLQLAPGLKSEELHPQLFTLLEDEIVAKTKHSTPRY